MLSTFYPKNDGEKWSRKIYFEITPCGKMVIFITQFVILGTFIKKGKKLFLDHFSPSFLGQIFFGYRFHFEVPFLVDCTIFG